MGYHNDLSLTPRTADDEHYDRIDGLRMQGQAFSFAQRKAQWERHECPSDSGVCGCSFDFHCESCGNTVVTAGESMPTYIGIGGVCDNCHFGKQTRFDEWAVEQGYEGLDDEQTNLLARYGRIA